MDLALLRRDPITDGEWQRLIDWAATLGEVESKSRRVVAFRSADCGSPEINVEASPASLEPEDDFSAMGWRPREEAVVWLGKNQPSDPAVVARATLTLMRKLPSLADFGGLIGPTKLAQVDDGKALAAHATRVRPFMSSLPGRFFEVRYSINMGEDYRVSHVVDEAFLEAWLVHPAFHLINEWQS